MRLAWQQGEMRLAAAKRPSNHKAEASVEKGIQEGAENGHGSGPNLPLESR
jgi:hypothetical protein